MYTVLVVGASGYLGRHVVAELHDRGYRVRALVRDRSRAEAAGSCRSPGLDGLVDEWLVGDVTDAEFTRDAARGAEKTVSALGVTRQGNDPWEIDNLANLNILNSALVHGVRSFTYVHVLGGNECPTAMTRAKSAFTQTLDATSITSQVICPPAYFSDMAELLRMARRGLIPVIDPGVRINPIHGADLAKFIVDRLENGDGGSWDVGGPEILTWSELADTAFEAVGKKARAVRVPRMVMEPALRLLSLFNPRAADTARFTTWNMMNDAVGPVTGSRRLADFYAETLDA